MTITITLEDMKKQLEGKGIKIIDGALRLHAAINNGMSVDINTTTGPVKVKLLDGLVVVSASDKPLPAELEINPRHPLHDPFASYHHIVEAAEDLCRQAKVMLVKDGLSDQNAVTLVQYNFDRCNQAGALITLAELCRKS